MWPTTDREVAIGALRRLNGPTEIRSQDGPVAAGTGHVLAAVTNVCEAAHMEHTYDFDLAVIGSGPGGQKAAIMAAKLGKKVCVIDSNAMVGGVCVNTGTIPSKTLREAVLYLTGMQQRDMYGASYRVKDEITISDLLARLQHVIGRETEVIRNATAAQPHRADRRGAPASSIPHTLSIDSDGLASHRTLTADKIVIATGTTPARPKNIDFDGARVLDSDQILTLDKVPDSLVVVGAGVIGVEYASMFAALGTRVTLVEKRAQMLDFCDPEIVESLKFHLRDLSMSFRFGEEVPSVESSGRGTITTLASGKRIAAEVVMYSAGRQGNTDGPQPRSGRARGRQAGPAGRRRHLRDRGAAHLRGRRRDRLPGAGRDVDGSGPAGRRVRVRGDRQRAARTAAHRHLHHPGDLLLRTAARPT